MTSQALSFSRSLGALFHTGVVGDLPDGQLLARFTTGHDADESAFGALVERHGPMVLRVCRRLLDDPNDAEDAFQATFLVLLRQARSIRHSGSLAAWLHGVADGSPPAPGLNQHAGAGSSDTPRGRPRSGMTIQIAWTSRRSSTSSWPGCQRNTASRSCSATSRSSLMKVPPTGWAGRSAQCGAASLGRETCCARV